MISGYDFTDYLAAVGLFYSLHLITDGLVYILMKVHCHHVMTSGNYHKCKYWTCLNYYKCPYNLFNYQRMSK